jgi:hypothetical protein
VQQSSRVVVVAKPALHAHDQVVRLQIVGQGIAHGAKFAAHRREEDTELIHAAYLSLNGEGDDPDRFSGRKEWASGGREPTIRITRLYEVIPRVTAVASKKGGVG